MKLISLSDFISLIDQEIHDKLQDFDKYPNIQELASYHLQKKGSRMIPIFAYWVARVLDLNLTKTIVVATAVELFHNFTLIHDDIIDRDTWRRGQTSLWAKFSEEEAIVIGDALNNLSILELNKLNDTDIDKKEFKHILSSFSQYSFKVYQGEYYDITYGRRNDIKEEDSIMMNRLKSGSTFAIISYLLSFMGSGDKNIHLLFEDMGYNVGIYLQIINDLTDYMLDGKNFSDWRNKKKSLPFIYLTLQERYKNLEWNNLSIESVMDIIEDSKVHKKTLDKAQEYRELSLYLLDEIEQASMEKIECQSLKDIIRNDLEINKSCTTKN